MKKRLYSNEIKNSKLEDWKKFCSNKGSLDPWRTIHKICSNRPSIVSPIHVAKDNGVFAESYQEAGEVFFDKWFTPDDCSTETSYHRQIRGQLEYVFDNNQDKLSPISTDSLQDAINSLKPLKAPGLDGIVNIVIKKNSHVLAPTLLKIYNACLNIKYFPRDWKKAKIIVIPKRGRINDGLPSSYRPISLIPVFGKIFERILSYILNDLSINKDWISNNQFGFVNGKSTVDALDKLVTTVEENNKLKKFTLCLLFDIKGAFDNAWHPGILKKSY